MPEKEFKIEYESWAAGYRAAVCDLTPVPVAPPARKESSGVLVGYFIGLLVAYLVYKLSKGQ